jgi:tRNA threonylcarbamoyladenosine biosynthesis protein TsaB
MKLLAFETATGAPHVCVRVDEQMRCWRGVPRSDPDVVLAGALDLLAQADIAATDLNAIACGRGPGAFTGVRLAIALAQGFALGAGCPLVAVSELAALAWRAYRLYGWRRVIALLDARRGEIYRAAYECAPGELRGVEDEALAAPGKAIFPAGEWALAGPGAHLVEVPPGQPSDPTLAPDAEAIAELAATKFRRGEILTPSAIAPLYLREQVATPKAGGSACA